MLMTLSYSSHSPFSVEEYDDNTNANLEACMTEMRTWLAANHLNLNDEQTEFLLVGQKQLLNRIGKDQSIVINSVQKTLVLC